MKRYDSYKDSGVEWIGEIPSGWEVKKIKHHSKVNVGLVINPSIYFDDNGTVPIITGKNVQVTGIDLSKVDFITEESNKLLKKTQIYEGDLVSMRVGYPGRTCTVRKSEDGINCCSLIITRKSNSIQSKILEYQLNSNIGKTQVELCQGGMGQQVVNLSDWNEFYVLTPPLSEQQQIVTFLDTKTSLIDSLIEKTQQKIELLKEKRTSLINEVVTKGLNPNVEMKDSGVEWIGEIPSHWKKTSLKYNSYMKGRIGWKGLKQDEFLDKGDYYLITGHDIKKDKMNWENCYHISKERYEESPEIMLREGDLLFTKDGTIGKTLYIESLPKPTSLNSHLLVIRPMNRFYSSKFLQYMFKTTQFLMYVEHNKTGTTFYGMSQNSMENFKGYFPPLDEQQQIVEYLDEQTQLIDKTVSIEEKRIELLKEYRQSLISEVVTGKLKVTTDE